MIQRHPSVPFLLAFCLLGGAAGWRCAGFRSSGQLGDGTTLEPTRATRVMSL